jgi:hypothetical protein
LLAVSPRSSAAAVIVVLIVAAERGPMAVSAGLGSRGARPVAMSPVFLAMRPSIARPILLFFVATAPAFLFHRLTPCKVFLFVTAGRCVFGI